MLAAHDLCVAQWTVFATISTVQDGWRLDPHVRGELHTYMCGRGSGVAAVTIAVDREAADASRGREWLRER